MCTRRGLLLHMILHVLPGRGRGAIEQGTQVAVARPGPGRLEACKVPSAASARAPGPSRGNGACHKTVPHIVREWSPRPDLSSDCSESPVAAGRIEPEVMKLPLACSIMILVEHTSSATGSGLVHARATGRGSCPKTAAAAVVRSV